MKSLAQIIRRSYLATSQYQKSQVPAVFLELESTSLNGRVVIKLHEHLVPEAAENFEKMCKGYEDQNGQFFTFRNKKFVNSLPNYFLETERIDETVFGEPIANENYDIQFDRPGLVALSRHQNAGLEVSGSGFFITLSAMPNLDRYVVVGEVVEGLGLIREGNIRGEQLTIVDCGSEGSAHV